MTNSYNSWLAETRGRRKVGVPMVLSNPSTVNTFRLLVMKVYSTTMSLGVEERWRRSDRDTADRKAKKQPRGKEVLFTND
ncbi:hypothetical protein PoB_000218500 [Plakobranchus ocellatus]|uniref:Uncharacterized protein n=1 Tax=Plakobranchus ocellatus TaxID=259542 RepID=A0AAV3XXY7_9GAST|nr:hypothetical protein PoB_000218500 [Plakobranchus ocellatus]